MRILIVTAGSRGDVAPYTGLGRRLLAAGHEVAVAAHPPFAGLVGGCGLDHRPLPGDPRELIRTRAEAASWEEARAAMAAFLDGSPTGWHPRIPRRGDHHLPDRTHPPPPGGGAGSCRCRGEAVLLHLAQVLGEHLLADPVQGAAQLGVAAGAVGVQLPQDEPLPLAADDIGIPQT
ncbi:hypothetical protein SANTM175S_05781 [Streptomyces antimycoticus]